MAEPNVTLPKERQTTLGLYVTAKEASEMWQVAAESKGHHE
jgi:hypothetical protein